MSDSPLQSLIDRILRHRTVLYVTLVFVVLTGLAAGLNEVFDLKERIVQPSPSRTTQASTADSTSLTTALRSSSTTSPIPTTATSRNASRYLVDEKYVTGRDTDVGLVEIDGKRYEKSFRSYVYFNQKIVVLLPSGHSTLKGTVGYSDESPVRDDGVHVQFEVTTERLRDTDPTGANATWVRKEQVLLPARGGKEIAIDLPAGVTAIRLSAVESPSSTQVAWGDLQLV